MAMMFSNQVIQAGAQRRRLPVRVWPQTVRPSMSWLPDNLRNAPLRRTEYAGLAGLGADNAPVGQAAQAYYRKGTPFLWLCPAADFGFAFSLDPGKDARAALASYLASHAYNVRVVYGQRGGPLEVSGTQNIDRNSALDIRQQITEAAETAGFVLTRPVQFNVEANNSPFRVGDPGSTTQWGDKLPPEPPRSIFSELGVDLSGDTSLLGGSLKNVVLYGAIGLFLFAVIKK